MARYFRGVNFLVDLEEVGAIYHSMQSNGLPILGTFQIYLKSGEKLEFYIDDAKQVFDEITNAIEAYVSKKEEHSKN